VFALLGLLSGVKYLGAGLVTGMLILAAGLLYGDGLITPAISILSAVEGLEYITAGLQPYVIWIAAGIVLALFAVQRTGTARVGCGSAGVWCCGSSVSACVGRSWSGGIRRFSWPSTLCTASPFWPGWDGHTVW